MKQQATAVGAQGRLSAENFFKEFNGGKPSDF